MIDFKNEKCPVCDVLIKDGDDIVVCPDCGAPHHRACWFELSHCANQEKHADGFEWKSQSAQILSRLTELENEEIRRQESEEQVELRTLETDKTAYIQTYMNSIQINGVSHDDEIEGIKIRDYIMFMGMGAHYYLPVFYRMSKTKSPISFNLSAGILAPLNQYYRRMNGFGIFLFLIMIIVSLPMILIVMSEFDGMKLWLESMSISVDYLYKLQNSLSYMSFAVTILICLFNDRIYFKFVTKKIKALKEQYKDRTDYLNAIVRIGRPSIFRMIANSAISVLLFLIMIYVVILIVQS